jgi:hypothetical protein
MLHRVSITNQAVEMVAHLPCPLSLKNVKKMVPADSWGSLVLYARTCLSLPCTETNSTSNLTGGEDIYIEREAQKLANSSVKCYCVIPLELEKLKVLPSQWLPHRPQCLKNLIRWQKRELGMKPRAAVLRLAYVFIHRHLETRSCSRSVFCGIAVHATVPWARMQISTFTSRFLGFGLVTRDLLSYILFRIPKSSVLIEVGFWA